MFSIIILYSCCFLIINNQCKKLSSFPKYWLQHPNLPDENHRELFYFYLKQQNNDLLNEHLRISSNPNHDLYHKTPWLTFDQINQIVRPDPISNQRLFHYLWSSQVNINECRQSQDGAILVCPIFLSIANKIFSANYTKFRHSSKNINITRTLSFILPDYLSEHIITITPSTIFPHFSSLIDSTNYLRIKRDNNLCSCQAYTLPCYLRKRYDIHQYYASSSSNVTLSVIGLIDQYINNNDTDLFLNSIDKNSDLSKFQIDTIGYNNQSKPGREASLDIQYALAIARGIKILFWSISNSNDPFSDFLFQLADMKYPPNIISISYGFSETANDYNLFQKAINQELQKAAARGVTIIVATGDSGVGGDSVHDCHTYRVNFPASSPWVTAVGGTMECFEQGAYFSGGGFSAYDLQPIYQENSVFNYFKDNNNTLPHPSLFNSKGRAIPDLSLRATRYLNIVNGLEKLTSGTSAAAPTFAAIIALLNDYQVRQGRKQLGFINPLLYEYASKIFYDITTGHNPGCNTTGFHAAKGWDPVTGLGTPSFIRFQQVLDTIGKSK